MKKEKDQDRRRFPRLGVGVEIKYRIFDPDDKKMVPHIGSTQHGAKSSNVTIEGICIKTGQQLAGGTLIGLELFFPGNENPVSAIGKVMWSKASEKEHEYLSGVEIVLARDKVFD